MKRTLVLLAILIGIVAFATSANAQVIFSNPYDFESTNAYSSFFDETPVHSSYADFYYDGPGFTMTDFHWWGTPWDFNSDIQGFGFNIFNHDDASGKKGDLLYHDWVDGDAGATTTGDDVVGNEVFSYGMDLNTPFEMTAGHYWFQVYAVSDGSLENWFWALGDGTLWDQDWQLQFVDTDPQWQNVAPDFAYEITGYEGTVPEPATLTLLGLGLLGLAARRRRK